MTQSEIAAYYNGLTNGEKGRFTAFLSLSLGGSPHTWQQKFLLWAKNNLIRPVSPLVAREIGSIISEERWRQ
jgi:hypothetical protein